MASEPGRLMASGRAADVYDLGDGTVLRRYRSGHDATVEGRVMRWVGEQGVAVPQVHRVDGPDIVMDLVPGPTMLADLGARPWQVFGHARRLARLQRAVNELRSPPWLPRRPGVPDAGEVTHLDLHPMNVILSPDGPVIIDWTNVASGDGSFDASMSFVLMSTFETSGARDRIGQRVLVESFRRLRGRRDVARSLGPAAEYRLTDSNVTPGEARALRRIIDRSSRRPV
jgi:aminoglycoside phosphotransferase (APT) family kinase protein